MSWVWTLWPFAAWALVAAFWLLALAGVACDGSALRWRVRTSEKGGLFSGSAPLPFCVWPALPEATGRTAEIVGVFMVQPDQWGWRVRRYMVAEISSLASCSVRFSRTSCCLASRACNASNELRRRFSAYQRWRPLSSLLSICATTLFCCEIASSQVAINCLKLL